MKGMSEIRSWKAEGKGEGCLDRMKTRWSSCGTTFVCLKSNVI